MTERKEVETAEEARYKVGDVCRIADVQPYVLRYWESEFAALAADRSSPGPRTYSARELKIIERIKKLLYDEGYTIAGAKKRLDGELKKGSAEQELFESAEEAGPARHAVPIPPPLPTSAVQEAELRHRGRGRASTAAVKGVTEEPIVFEESLSPAPAKTAPVDPITATVVKPRDPRVARVVAELKEILALLSKDEP